MSEKIMGMLSVATGNISDTLAKKASKSEEPSQSDQLLARSNMTVDSLLREIAARHPIEDECTYKETITRMREGRREAEKRLRKLDGQKIVFIGYFKNRVALQIQKLLISRGYKAHIEISKTGDGQESFIFCGPFKKEKYAQVLLEWLLKHDFSEARIISVTKEVSGQSLYESISGDSSMPINIERAENENDVMDDLDDSNGTTQATGQQIQGQNANVQSNTVVPNNGVANLPAVVQNNMATNSFVGTPASVVLPNSIVAR